jgi:hypothetical protein
LVVSEKLRFTTRALDLFVAEFNWKAMLPKSRWPLHLTPASDQEARLSSPYSLVSIRPKQRPLSRFLVERQQERERFYEELL